MTDDAHLSTGAFDLLRELLQRISVTRNQGDVVPSFGEDAAANSAQISYKCCVWMRYELRSGCTCAYKSVRVRYQDKNYR